MTGGPSLSRLSWYQRIDMHMYRRTSLSNSASAVRLLEVQRKICRNSAIPMPLKRRTCKGHKSAAPIGTQPPIPEREKFSADALGREGCKPHACEPPANKADVEEEDEEKILTRRAQRQIAGFDDGAARSMSSIVGPNCHAPYFRPRIPHVSPLFVGRADGSVSGVRPSLPQVRASHRLV